VYSSQPSRIVFHNFRDRITHAIFPKDNAFFTYSQLSIVALHQLELHFWKKQLPSFKLVESDQNVVERTTLCVDEQSDELNYSISFSTVKISENHRRMLEKYLLFSMGLCHDLSHRISSKLVVPSHIRFTEQGIKNSLFRQKLLDLTISIHSDKVTENENLYLADSTYAKNNGVVHFQKQEKSPRNSTFSIELELREVRSISSTEAKENFVQLMNNVQFTFPPYYASLQTAFQNSLTVANTSSSSSSSSSSPSPSETTNYRAMLQRLFAFCDVKMKNWEFVDAWLAIEEYSMQTGLWSSDLQAMRDKIVKESQRTKIFSWWAVYHSTRQFRQYMKCLELLEKIRGSNPNVVLLTDSSEKETWRMDAPIYSNELDEIRDHALAKWYVLQVRKGELARFANFKEKSRDHFLNSLNVNPHLTYAYVQLGWVLYELCETEIAWACWDHARKLVSSQHSMFSAVHVLESSLLKNFPHFFLTEQEDSTSSQTTNN